jgi:hypothetical protein
MTGTAGDGRVLNLLECLDLVMALVALFSAFLGGLCSLLACAAAVNDGSESRTAVPMATAANISFFPSMMDLLSISQRYAAQASVSSTFQN